MVEGTDSLELGGELAPCDFQVVGFLGAKPVAIGETEEAAEAQIRIRLSMELNLILNKVSILSTI